MRGMWTIAWKDFKGYLTGPSFYFVAGLFAAFMSGTYITLLQHFAQRSMEMSMMRMGSSEGPNLHREVVVGHISNINLVLLILVPFLTVRLFAEEKKMKTFDLLLTCPVTATQIVLGKFLAALMATWSLLTLSLIYPIATAFFTQMQWGPMFAAYLGMYLLCGIYVAIGVFASSLTESVILSGFVSIILTLGLWFFAWTTVIVEEPTLNKIFTHMSVSHHFGEFVQGSVALNGIVFAVSVIAVYAFLTQRVVESARWR